MLAPSLLPVFAAAALDPRDLDPREECGSGLVLYQQIVYM